MNSLEAEKKERKHENEMWFVFLFLTPYTLPSPSSNRHDKPERAE